MKNLYKNITLLLTLSLFAVACEDEFEYKKSNQLLILGANEVFVGDFNVFEVNDFSGDVAYDWEIAGLQPSATSGTGRETEVSFDVPGTYTVTFTQGNKSGSLEVQAVSRLLSLSGDSTIYRETNRIDTIGFQVIVQNDFVAGEVSINYSIGGNAIEGVDYELVSENPLVLDGGSEESEYFIYIRMLKDNDREAETKFVTATITSVTSELEDEVVLDEVEFLTSGFEIEDNIIVASVTDPRDVLLANPTIIEVEVSLSSAPVEDITINYSVTGIGVNDFTPSSAGSITFEGGDGQKTKNIFLQFNANAFVNPQNVLLTLESIVSNNEEVELNFVQKKFIIQ